MSKKKVRKVKSGKCHRWKKGHSCISNPEKFNHREAAKGRFFQKVEDSSLTVEALAQHTASLAVANGKSLCADPEDDQSIGKSFNTFATHITTCTNPAFEKFFQNFTVGSEIHTHMLAVHAAAQEYIGINSLPDTSTSYLCSFMQSLEGMKDSEEDVAAILSLMARVIRKVSPEVLRLKYGEFEKLLFEVFTIYTGSENVVILTNVIGCLSVLLRSQGISQWEHSFTMHLLSRILDYTTHDNVKVCRCAQYNVSAIIKGSIFMKSNDFEDEKSDEELDAEKEKEIALRRHFNLKPMIEHPAARSVGDFILQKFKSVESDEMSKSARGKMSLQLLIFLQQVITHLPKDTLTKCCSVLLHVMHIGNSTINNRALKVLQALFTADTKTALEKDVNEALLNALIQSRDIKNASLAKTLKLVPSMNDATLCCTWMAVVASGILNLARMDVSAAVHFVPLFIKLLAPFWKSDHESVHEKIFFTVEYLLDDLLEPLGKELASNYAAETILAFEAVEEALSLRYEAAWPYICRTLAVFYRTIGKYNHEHMVRCLKNLAEMCDSPSIHHRPYFENVIGAAIQYIGPEEVTEAVPVRITGNINVDEKYLWILPLLKRYVKGARLCFFVSYFVPLASKCVIILQSQRGKSNLLVKTYEVIERQIWALFPGFANGALDIQEAFTMNESTFAKLLCDNIKYREDIRLDLLAGLRNVIFESKENPELMIKYSKNYMPVLFNIYLTKPRDRNTDNSQESTVEPGQRLAVLMTIQTYLEILPPTMALLYFNLIMKRFDDEIPNSIMQRGLLNLARTFIPYLETSILLDIFSKITPHLCSNDSEIQKTAYRIIQDILSGQNNSSEQFFGQCREELVELLLNYSNEVKPNAAAARLKCFSLILAKLDQALSENDLTLFLERVTLEAVGKCSRKHSVACRKAAFTLLTDVGRTVQRLFELSDVDSFLRCLNLLPQLDPSSSLTSNTIIALTVFSNQYRELIPVSTLSQKVTEISNLFSNANRDTVKCSLAYIKLLLKQYPPAVMSDLIEQIVEAIMQMPDDCRRKLRLRVRDILSSLVRKFGADRIKGLTQTGSKMQNMVVNVVKSENRKKRMRKLANQEVEEEEETDAAPSTLDEILAEIDREIEDDHKAPPQKVKRSAKARMNKKKNTWVIENEDEIVDLMDATSSDNIRSRKPKTKQLRFEDDVHQNDEEKYGFKIDKKTNKFIIKEERDNKDFIKTKEDDDNDDFVAFDELNEIVTKDLDDTKKPQQQEQMKRKRSISEGSDSLQQHPTKMGPAVFKKGKKKEFDYGAEFRSKKAGGDKMKKGGVSPYAYVQFSKEKLNRRKKSKYTGQFRELVKGKKRKNKGSAKRK